MGCNGGLPDLAFQYIIANGLTNEEQYPYVGQDQSCKYTSSMKKVGATSYTDVDPTQAALKTAVAQTPIAIGIYAIPWMSYSGGIYSDISSCPSSESLLDHGVLVTGYGSENGQDYWIVKNSWGASWGEKGYIRFARSDTGPAVCGLDLAASFAVSSN